MNKKAISVVILGLIASMFAYVAYKSFDQLQEFDFEDPFSQDLEE